MVKPELGSPDFNTSVLSTQLPTNPSISLIWYIRLIPLHSLHPVHQNSTFLFKFYCLSSHPNPDYPIDTLFQKQIPNVCFRFLSIPQLFHIGQKDRQIEYHLLQKISTAWSLKVVYCNGRNTGLGLRQTWTWFYATWTI